MKARLKRAVHATERRFNRRVFYGVFVVMMIAVAIHTLRQPRMYEARGEIGFRFAVVVQSEPRFVESRISCGPTINTVREVMASGKIMQQVIARLAPEERRTFLEPYQTVDDSDAETERLVLANRRIKADTAGFAVDVSYRHPDRLMAARIVGLHLSEFEALEKRVRAEDEAAALKELEMRADQTRQKGDEWERAVVAYRERQSTSDDGRWESDEGYRALVEKRDEAKKLETMIRARLAEMRSPDRAASSMRHYIQYPIIPAAGDYLITPVLVRAACGATVAGFLAGVIALLVGRRSTFNPREETL